jgi:SAM-dependent MidA family methyltransferase
MPVNHLCADALPWLDGAAAERVARDFPSFRDFVDDALFHPQWGYYSTGAVRFGVGGHFDTFPLALSPVFGRMVARYAYRSWCRRGRPPEFEICELGAGNGQLCLDVLLAVAEATRGGPSGAGWSRFSRILRYRIIERSPALIRRQRQHLGPLAERVVWLRADLAKRRARSAPFASHGLVVANEVLDCLAHHKVIAGGRREPGVVFVVPVMRGHDGFAASRLVRGLTSRERAVPRDQLGAVLADPSLRTRVTCREVLLPCRVIPGLSSFVRRHYPEFFGKRRFPPYFACPAVESIIRNSAQLYRDCEALWIDYGDGRDFHVGSPEHRRIYAGPPRSNTSLYSRPGSDDITFMVDFSVVAAAARRAGLAVDYYGGQAELARRSGVELDQKARDVILHYRALSWMLALIGIGPERSWQQTGLTWGKHRRGGRIRDDVQSGIEEFLGTKRSKFRLMILRSSGQAESS